MIRFKGRSSLKQYVPKKPIRRGMKTWIRADSSNGYHLPEMYSFRENVTTNLGESVVIKLARELVRGNYHLFFNNYFTTVPLLEKLLQDEIYACGTFRIDTKFNKVILYQNTSILYLLFKIRMYDAPYKADILVVVPNYNCYTFDKIDYCHN